MDVFDLYAKLSLDSSNYDRSLQNASSAADQWATKFVIGAKVVTSAFVGVGKMITGIASQAVDAFSSFEQLEGGVQTLFGTQGKSFEEWSASFSESSDSMQDYIDVARRVINGDFGVGAERRDLLAAAGYDPDTVQQMVNNLINGVDVATNVSADTIAANMQTAEEKYASLERAQAHAMENAQMAYATAGMSANEYMDTINSFAAGLISSLGGDTEKAVDVADMAVRDMSDNANKMGTDIASIQAAYQGFAKQNYTMLDNLKLGYGGTKTEMERLLKDAEKISGVKYDINNLADVYEAIHVVQEEMGITGTTAEEAAETIEGSSKAMKAAWSNVLTSLVTGGEFFDKSIEGLVTSVTNYVHNVMPAFTGALKGISSLIQELAPVIISELPGLVNDVVPGLIDALITVFATLADELPAIIDIIIDVLPSVVEKVADALVRAAPNIIAGLIKIAGTIVKSLPKIFSSVIKGIPKVFSKAFSEIGNVFKDGSFFSFFSELFTGVGDAFSSLNWGTLGESIFKGITSVLDLGGNFLLDIFNPAKDKVARNVSWGDIGKGAVNGLQSVLDGGVQVVSGLGSAVSSAAQNINWNQVGAVIAGCINGAATAAGGLIDSVKWESIGETVGDMINGAVEIASSLIDSVEWDLLGSNVGGMINGVASTANSFITGIEWENIGQTFGNSVNAIFSTANSFLTATDWTLIGETAGDAINGIYTTVDSALTAISWETIGQTFGNSVNAIFSTANSFLKTMDWGLIGANAANSINGVSTTISSTLSTISWETIGQTFGNSVNAIFSTANSALTTTDWGLIGKTAGDTLNSAYTTVDTFLTETDWALIGATYANSVNSIFTTANSALENTDWDLIGANAADAVNGAATVISSAITGTDWTLIGSTFSNSVNSVFITANSFLTTLDWSGIGTAAADAVNTAVSAIKGAIESIDAEGIGTMLGERINGIFNNANTFLETSENFTGGFLNFGLGISEGVEQLGTNTGKKIGSWLGGLFGGGDAQEEESLELNLPEIDDGTLTSYQLLADAITAINNAIWGGAAAESEGEAAGMGLTAAFEALPGLFAGVLAAAMSLAAYFAGDFLSAVVLLTNEIAIITTNEEGETNAAGGNTLYNALGSIQGELEDIYFDSQQLAAYWTGTFTGAIATLKDSIGEGQGALESMGAAVSGLTGQFTALVMAIQQVVAEYIAMNKILNGGDYSGGGGASKGNGIDPSDLFRASGGPVRGGQSYVVGEDGPEWFTPSRSGYIRPNSELAGAKGDTIINVTFEGDVIGDERSIRDLVGKAVKAGIRREVMAGV